MDGSIFLEIGIRESIILFWVLPGLINALLFFTLNRYAAPPTKISEMSEQDQWGIFWLVTLIWPVFWMGVVIGVWSAVTDLAQSQSVSKFSAFLTKER